MSEGLRIALLSYRSKPHCGGQGVYVRQLSRELTALGHRVEVFSGQPYPELDPGVRLREVPSLNLYRDGDPFRLPHPREFTGPVDALELAAMWTAAFPEPLTFSLRALHLLRQRAADFDVVHDNQGLGYGLLRLGSSDLPVLATVHHPVSVDRRIDVAEATGLRRITLRRWYGFVRMQRRVARSLSPLITVSESSASDIVSDFGVARERVRVVPLGVDTRVFHPGSVPRRPGSIIAVASADVPLKGIGTLLGSVAKLATERDVTLTVVGRVQSGGPTERLVGELGIADRVHFVSGVPDEELAALLSSAEVAVVPSLYEGFSLPAVEAMACGTPVVASRAAALPEVVGDDGECARLVAPGDSEDLAGTIAALLDSEAARARMGTAGWQRVRERFTWRAVAEETVRCYEEAMARGPVQGRAGSGAR